MLLKNSANYLIYVALCSATLQWQHCSFDWLDEILQAEDSNPGPHFETQNVGQKKDTSANGCTLSGVKDGKEAWNLNLNLDKWSDLRGWC